MFPSLKSYNANEFIMRTYPFGAAEVENYTTEMVNPFQAFPRGTFLMTSDYALVGLDGSLRWLTCVRVYKGKEYCEFSGQDCF